MKKPWMSILLAYGMWVIFILLGVLFLVVSRNSLSTYLSMYYIQGNFQHGKEAAFINQAYFLVAALILIILMILVEEYFKNGARKGLLTRRIARVMGLQVLFIFGASTAGAVMLGFSPLIILVSAAELALGLFLVWFGFKAPRQTIPQ